LIRVLNIISDTNIGGAGRVLLNYLAYSDRARFETLVALPRDSLLKPPLEAGGARVLEVDGIADRSYDRKDVQLLQERIRATQPALVHTHASLSGRIAAKRCHIPVVYTRHSAFPVPAKLRYPPGRWINKLVNEHYTDRIIAVSPAAAQNLTDAGISSKKITIIMNGVGPVSRASEAAQAALRQELGLSGQEVVFGILARVEDYKGHVTIVQAAKHLKERGYRQFRVLAAGTGSFETQAVRAAEELEVQDCVTFLGFRSDVAALLSILDVQLNASYGTEATSLSLLEGMSLGLPTIASDYGGNPWLIEHGRNGLLFPARDSQALARAMARLIDHPEERKVFGSQGEALYASKFTGKRFAQNIEEVYLSMLKGGSHGA